MVPPGPTTTLPGTDRPAPALADCGRTSTVHVPEPPPASDTLSRSVRFLAPPLTLRSPKDSEAGSVKIFGSSADCTLTRPPPARSTEASAVRSVFPHAGPADDTSADLT